MVTPDGTGTVPVGLAEKVENATLVSPAVQVRPATVPEFGETGTRVNIFVGIQAWRTSSASL
jgi:hypothetical protein